MNPEIFTAPPQERVLDQLRFSCPFNHPDLAMVSLNGSQQRKDPGAESDIDIFTIMRPKNPEIVDTDSIIHLGLQLNNFCHQVSSEFPQIMPVVVSTIRLEEAQIEMAKLLNPDRSIVPIHWLHHPSVQFLLTNEPPELVKNLLNGKPIFGQAPKPNGTIDKLAGLDWLTDSFRILVANFSLRDPRPQSNRFLLKHSLHNLDYFWKWRINPLIGSDTPEFKTIHNLRHLGALADVDQVVKLHQLTFALWPTL